MLDAPLPRLVVVSMVIALGHRQKVLKAVIVLDAIEVMNVPPLRGRAVSRFPDKDVLSVVAGLAGRIRVADENVTVPALTTPTLPRRVILTNHPASPRCT